MCRSGRIGIFGRALTAPSLAGNAANPGLEPGLAERLQQRVAEASRRQENAGEPAVLLVPPQLAGRGFMQRPSTQPSLSHDEELEHALSVLVRS